MAPCAAPRATFLLLPSLRHVLAPTLPPVLSSVRVRASRAFAWPSCVVRSRGACPSPQGLHGFMLPGRASQSPFALPTRSPRGSPVLTCCLADVCLPADLVPSGLLCSHCLGQYLAQEPGPLMLAELLPGLSWAHVLNLFCDLS